MTEKELGEIERLAEEWHRHEHFSDSPPLAKRVLPLVKALREARAAATRQTERLMQSEELTDLLHKERDEARAERDKYKSALDAELPAAWREDIESLNSCLERIGKERDEARAEVERLRDIVAVNDQRLADVWDTAKRVLKGEG